MYCGGILKALVTGGTGFIGSHLVDLLISQNYEVICLVRKTSDLRWLNNKPVKLVYVSLQDVEGLKEVVKDVDYIFHVAGVVAGKKYEDYLIGNRDATRNLITAAKESFTHLKRFVHVSSQTVSGPSPSLESPMTEEMECKPITAYGRSKKAAEEEVIKFKGLVPYTIVRPPAVIGPRDPASVQIFQVANKGLGTLIGFGKKYINMIHSSDLVNAIYQASKSENTIDKIYFVASEEVYNWEQITSLIKKHLNKSFFITLRIPHFVVYVIAAISGFFGKFSKKPPVFNFDKGRDFVQKYWTCSVQQAKNDFGFKQNLTLDAAIKNCIDWYKENNWL